MDMGTLSSRGSVGTDIPASKILDIKEATAVTGSSSLPAEELQTKSMTEPDREQVLAAVEEMQNFVQATHHDIQFKLDDDNGRMLITVTERGTGDVIRQIPSEEAVRLAENLSEIRSLLFSAEA